MAQRIGSDADGRAGNKARPNRPRRLHGRYLNVAAMWLWSRADHYHFDTEGSRVHAHIDFRGDEQFEAAAQQLAAVAKKRVQELRRQFPTLDAVAEHLRATPLTEAGWPASHAGFAAALTGDRARAQAAFDAIASSKRTNDSEFWESFRGVAAELRELCVDSEAFRAWASNAVAESRGLLKLSSLPSPAFV